MLTQGDVIRLLGKQNPPCEQAEAFQIIAAYIFSKSSSGNLPIETLAKISNILRKLAEANARVVAVGSPVSRALESARAQLAHANRKWDSEGPRALGALGQVGQISTPDALFAWKKATGVKTLQMTAPGEHAFPGIDAGRIMDAHSSAMYNDAPPVYSPPPAAADSEPAGENGGLSREQVENGGLSREQIEAGRQHLAAMREQTRANDDGKETTTRPPPRDI